MEPGRGAPQRLRRRRRQHRRVRGRGAGHPQRGRHPAAARRGVARGGAHATHEAVLGAVALACSRWTGAPAVLVDVEGHGREPIDDALDLSQTVGWFTSVFPVVIELGSRQPQDAARTASREFRAVPGHGLTYGLIRHTPRRRRGAAAARGAVCNRPAVSGPAGSARGSGAVRPRVRAEPRRIGVRWRLGDILLRISVALVGDRFDVLAVQPRRASARDHRAAGAGLRRGSCRAVPRRGEHRRASSGRQLPGRAVDGRRTRGRACELQATRSGFAMNAHDVENLHELARCSRGCSSTAWWAPRPAFT